MPKERAGWLAIRWVYDASRCSLETPQYYYEACMEVRHSVIRKARKHKAEQNDQYHEGTMTEISLINHLGTHALCVN